MHRRDLGKRRNPHPPARASLYTKVVDLGIGLGRGGWRGEGGRETDRQVETEAGSEERPGQGRKRQRGLGGPKPQCLTPGRARVQANSWEA